MDSKQILLIGDMVGYGKLATSVMVPILAHMGYSTYNIPTALVSNNFGYGKYALSDTTDYIRQTFQIWRELGFTFDAIATGFIPSLEQAKLIAGFCKELSESGVPVFVDPIMGDGGELYSGMTNAMVTTMRPMIEVAHVTCPNYTEACLLTGIPFHKEGISRDEAFKLVDSLHKMGAKSVVVTSTLVEGIPSVIGYNHFTGNHFTLAYEELPIQFSGTGDIFSAVMIGKLMNGDSFEEAVRKAMDTVYRLIDLNKDAKDPYKGILVERNLDVI